jgi:potassium-dependent mechanosensitive channel
VGIVCGFALLANALGYVRLANLLGNGALNAGYVALILYAVFRILDGLAMIALRLPPLSLLRMVREHRPLIRHRIDQVLQLIGFPMWLLYTLRAFAVEEPVTQAFWSALGAQARLGAVRLSLGDVLAFALAVWAAILVSRLVRFVLEEDVYPRTQIAQGPAYAVSTMAHYAILLAGFLIAVATLGVDMTGFTILAGAFTVGVGFGLQNIFNNFISGLILLFERPVQVGDLIELDPASSGVVQRIGIRASIIRAANGAEIIVPNGRLISDRFVNWTLSNRRRIVDVPVAVPLATDPVRAIAALEQVARAHPQVAEAPAPHAIVTRMGPDWMGLELRAWTPELEAAPRIRSELAVQAAAALEAQGIKLR